MLSAARGLPVSLGIASLAHLAAANELNTHNLPHKKNFRLIICPFLSTLIHEEAMEVKASYTREELEDITEAAGLPFSFVEAHATANFINNPSHVQDIFNMEGASNEHVTSTGVHDCNTCFSNCYTQTDARDICETHTDTPLCELPNGKIFFNFVDNVDYDKDGFLTVDELKDALDSKRVPFNDANPVGHSTILGSHCAIFTLFHSTRFDTISVHDLHTVFILRRFPSGYYFGRKPPQLPPSPGVVVVAESKPVCFPGHAILLADDGPTVMSEIAIGRRVLTEGPAGDLRFERVVGFMHELRDGVHESLEIAFVGTMGARGSSSSSLRASASHLVFLDDGEENTTDKAAGALRAGDRLRSVDAAGEVQIQTILSLRRTTSQTGVFAPLVASGKVVVDGVIASAYASSSEATLAPPHCAMHAAMFAARLELFRLYSEQAWLPWFPLALGFAKPSVLKV
eukprot:TRINITY_DN18705_c0_g1_i1.p1 TRINITY_DN18705_c0_g1~~TRINITY_DN18705_c0_g1_i1.p1  ORF type:complete len:457 (-),score=79.04 TRINITY_DN18705_c0_g1_i1:108-1478(-)